ncbi:sulfite exporter TauE/SafE family protein [Rhizobium binxianense]
MAFELALSPTMMVAVFAIVVAGAFVQAGLGMGFGLTTVPLLALIDPELVPAPTLFLGMLTAIWGALREREHIRWEEVREGVIGRFAGVLIGSALLIGISNRDSFTLLFGLMVGFAVLLSFAGWRLPFNRLTLFLMAAISGLMGTITSVGAPPLALIYQGRPAIEARPTLTAFFAAGCALSLAGLYFSGWAGLRELLLAIAMLPPMLVGTFIARRFAGRFDKRYRLAMLAVSGFAAVILILRAIL